MENSVILRFHLYPLNSHNFTEINSLCLDLITGLGLLKSQTTFLNNNPKATATGEGKELF